MNVAFRVDASSLIGTGHFVRCLTLAQELRRRGANTLFLSRNLPDHLADMLAAGQHGLARLNESADRIGGSADTHGGSGSMHATWLGTSQELDAAETLEALSGGSWEWLVVDHYGLDQTWESKVRTRVSKIAVIDDIADRTHDCDLLLDQNLPPDSSFRYDGKVPPACVSLIGPRFALLREEFRAAREAARPRDGAVARILIFFGGMDAANHTARAVEALTGLAFHGTQVDVVVGRRHPYVNELAGECSRNGFSYHVQTGRMAALIAAADLAVGAGGTAVWERCCLGLPQLAICTADNQRGQLAAAAAAGLVYLAEPADDAGTVIRRHTAALMENRPLRHRMSCDGMQAVDGRGTARVAAAMGSSGVEVRVATAADSRKLYEWRNNPAVRAVSRSTAPIEWDTHQRWLASVLNAADRSLLIGERRGSPVGVVRFDMHDSEAEISIYLVPGDHSPGEGGCLLASAERWLTTHRPEATRICAQVLAGNTRSERLFLGSGYRADSACYVKGIGGR